MRTRFLILLCIAALPALAHHSFAAEFDDKQPVTLNGTVVKFDFMNPRSWIYMDITKPDGKVERWAVETGSTNALFRRGCCSWGSSTSTSGRRLPRWPRPPS
jgi:hypothetical protein